MTKPKPKTHAQLQRIFGLGHKWGFGKEDLEELCWEISDGKIERLSFLTFDLANAMIERLGGEPFSAVSRRTVNYRRQQAGISQIATKQQLRFLDELAEKRGISETGLERLCRRMLAGRPRPRTTIEANKIIEAIKAMNRRDASTAAAGVSAGSYGRAA